MYYEIIVVAAILIFVCEYDGIFSFQRLADDNNDLFLKLKESDYDFLVKARYGDDVNIDELFNKRIRSAMIAGGLGMIIFIASLQYLTLLLIIGAVVLVYKMPYMDLKSYRARHMHEIDVQLPYYLKNLEILIQYYTVPVAIGKSIETAPAIFKEGLQRLIDSINSGDSSIEPYMQFAREYPVRDSMRMMRLLYRLSLGRQERKQEQLMSFSKTISNLQQKARETKYKERLEKMEGKTMRMLIVTGIGVMILLVVAIFMTFSSVGGF